MSSSEPAVSTTVRCGECGASRPGHLAASAERPPCAVCGATRLRFGVAIAETLEVRDNLSLVFEPAVPAQEWRRRWEDLERALGRLLAPQREGRSAASVAEASRELLGFYADAYQLKDALVHEAPALGLDKTQIEAAIDADPMLALLADLGNLAKHSRLTRVRTVAAPTFGSAVAEADSASVGWRLRLPVHHAGAEYDGLRLADDALLAWREQLTAWGLL